VGGTRLVRKVPPAKTEREASTISEKERQAQKLLGEECYCLLKRREVAADPGRTSSALIGKGRGGKDGKIEVAKNRG